MDRTTIDFGIDLGTTNSAISVVNGGEVETIKSGLSEIVPSMVNFDKRGTLRVGMDAAQQLNNPKSALDVHCEFKRVMGQRVQREFRSAGKSLSPEELSAEVLKALRKFAGVRFGDEPIAAVITVPAMFELPQNEATSRAARLAGFAHSQLLQEPVAAAVAYGFHADTDRAHWLVYDYGGGTFDASIIAVRDGELRVVKHAGDNYLGGADLDWQIVERFIVPRLQASHALSTLGRGANARDIDRGRMLVLKRYAEDIKKRLSTEETVEYFHESVFEDDDGNPVDLDCTIARNQFEDLARPAVERSFEIVQALIRDSGVPKASLDRLILVGGSTFMPLVRRTAAAIGIPLGLELDPMTVVSRGAAVFAASQRMPSELVRSAPVTAGTAKLSLEFEPVVKDLEPFVGGRVEVNGAPPSGATVSIVRDDSAWTSGEVPLDPKGMFFTNVRIREKGQSVFNISLRGPAGPIPCSPSSLAITYGLTTGNAPLPTGCGIGLADGSATILIPGGTRLPCPPVVHKAQFVRGLRKGSSETLRIPVLSGDDPVAEHNLVGAYIEIAGSSISRDIPPGAEVEIEISIDAGGCPSIQAFVPILDETFRFSSPLGSTLIEHEPPAAMRDRLRGIRGRLAEAGERAEEASAAALTREVEGFQVDPRLAETERLIGKWQEGDSVAAGQARALIVELSRAASELSDKAEFPASEAEYRESRDEARRLAAEHGDAKEKAAVEEILKEGDRAVAARDAKMVRHCTEQLRAMKFQMIRKDPGFWMGFLAHLHGQQEKFPDRAAARRLFAEGAAAAQRRDVESLQSVVQQLVQMLPREVAQAIQSGIGSDII